MISFFELMTKVMGLLGMFLFLLLRSDPRLREVVYISGWSSTIRHHSLVTRFLNQIHIPNTSSASLSESFHNEVYSCCLRPSYAGVLQPYTKRSTGRMYPCHIFLHDR
jgi:hypothetical protein